MAEYQRQHKWEGRVSRWQAARPSSHIQGSDGSRSGTGARCAAAPAAELKPCCSPLSIRGIASERPFSRLLPLWSGCGGSSSGLHISPHKGAGQDLLPPSSRDTSRDCSGLGNSASGQIGPSWPGRKACADASPATPTSPSAWPLCTKADASRHSLAQFVQYRVQAVAGHGGVGGTKHTLQDTGMDTAVARTRQNPHAQVAENRMTKVANGTVAPSS